MQSQIYEMFPTLYYICAMFFLLSNRKQKFFLLPDKIENASETASFFTYFY